MFKKTLNKRHYRKAALVFVLNRLKNDREHWMNYRSSFGYVEPGEPRIVITEGCFFYDVSIGSGKDREDYRYGPISGANKLVRALYPDKEADPIARLNAYLHEEERRIASLL